MKIKSSIRSPLKHSLAAFSLMEVTMGMGMIGMVAGAMLTGISSGFFTMKMARENQRDGFDAADFGYVQAQLLF